MRGGKFLITIGMIFLGSGIIFHLQGYSIIGPETSFMYSNPDWINYGIQIAVIGIIIVGTGVGISLYKRS